MPFRAWVDPTNVPGYLDWVAFILGAAGIGVALWQLFRARGALAAARQAYEVARVSATRDQLLRVLPRFEEIEISLENAMTEDSRPAAGTVLQRFNQIASEAGALLRSYSNGHTDAVADLGRAAASARLARAKLYGDLHLTTAEIVDGAAAQIRTVSSALSAAEVMIRSENREGKDDRN